ncbi:DUF551 domain-containing protein [Enterobacter cloacae]|nr:DUF551 domain-containing protein [Enterobacter cloacae]
MSIITREQAKDLRNAFQCWQQDYDPVEDKEQYDMFRLGVVAMETLLESMDLERGKIRRFDLDMSNCDSCGQDCGADMIEDFDGEYVLWDEVLPHLYRYDEYTAPPAPVSVPAAMEMDDDFDSSFEHGKAVGWNAYRAAMLQSFGNSEQLNSPAIPEGWVACVERMPSAGEKVLAYRPDAPESNDPLIKMATYVGGSAHGHGFDCYCKPTHWMPLPAAPQQEA